MGFSWLQVERYYHTLIFLSSPPVNIQKLIGLLSLVWIIVFGLLLHVRGESTVEVAGDSLSASSTLEIAFLDVGQGDATLFTFSNEQQMLLDCSINARILEALGRTMPFYDRYIDYLVVTHPDQDHYGGCIDVIDRYDIGTIVYTGYEKPETLFYHAFIDAVEASGAEYITISEPQVWEIASTSISFLYPVHNLQEDPNIPETTHDEANNSSIVMLVDHGDTEILLTGDGEEELEEFLIHEYGSELDVDILKAGHHGSNSSSIPPFVDITSPRHVVFSAGFENRYGHPTPRVVKRFERASSTVWRTDTMSDILLTVSNHSILINEQVFEIDRSNN